MKNKFLYIISILFISGGLCYAEPVKVEIKKEKGKYQLYRNGLPYFIKGAAGFKYYDKLKEFGGNSIRVWKNRRSKGNIR